jgi:hypothetical protein
MITLRHTRFKIFTAVTILIMMFWVQSPCSLLVEAILSEKRAVFYFRVDYGPLALLRKVGFCQRVHTVTKPERTSSDV